jgi:hypothetical protein
MTPSDVDKADWLSRLLGVTSAGVVPLLLLLVAVLTVNIFIGIVLG